MIGKGRFTMCVAAALAATAWLHPAAAQQVNGNRDADIYAMAAALNETPPPPLTGGTGTFTMASNVCAGVSTDMDTDELHADTCTFAGNGNYTNTVCGTGTFDGTATWTEDSTGVAVGGALGDDGYQVSFHVTVVGGIGLLTGTASEFNTGNDGESESGTVAGVVLLSASQPPFPGQCAGSLAVTAVLATDT